MEIATVDEMTKDTAYSGESGHLMSKQIGFLNDFRADDFSLGQGQDSVIFVSTSHSRFPCIFHPDTTQKRARLAEQSYTACY